VSWSELWFDWTVDAWPLLTAVLVGLGCALVGTIFTLRRAALLGDAVSHSILPGIAAGLLVAGLLGRGGAEAAFGASFAMLWILLGALAAGLSSTAIIEALHRYTRIKPDTALAAVFPAFFAAGVILIEVAARGAHFDAECVFYGSLETIGEFRKAAPALFSTVLVLAFFTLGYKELLITSFDPGLARALGLRTRLVDWLLVALLVLVVVSAFEAVGAILVVAFLIIPPATAYLLADRLHHVLFLAALFGMSSGALGSWLTVILEHPAIGFETARAPSTAVVAGAQFLAAFLLAPRRGLIAQYRRQLALRRRILDENFLGAVYRQSQAGGDGSRVRLEAVAGALGYAAAHLRPALRRSRRRGEAVDHEDGSLSLTRAGDSRVEQVIRAHRLWESYMHSEMGAAPDHVHAAADQIEHYLQPALIEELAAILKHPSADPHGKRIP
jgi:manganese/zinc/iron transport system permease protein